MAGAEDGSAEVQPGRAAEHGGQPDSSGGEQDARRRRAPRPHAVGQPPAEDPHRHEDRGVHE